MKVHDVIIIGGGPAGLTAGIYSGRALLDTIIIEKGAAGGLMAVTDKLENWPGHESITGAELSDTMLKQATNFGCELVMDEAKTVVREDDDTFTVKTGDGAYRGRTVIYTAGTTPRQLDVPGEREFTGRGVSYCATCDAPFYRDLRVAVVGGGDSALKEALYLTKFAKEVVVIHRRQGLRAEKIIQQKSRENEKLSFLLDSVVDEISGGDFVDRVRVKNVKSDELSEHGFDGVFVFIGYDPKVVPVRDLVELSPRGRIITRDDMGAGVSGLYVAGDVREKVVNQVSTAVGDGATAAVAAEHYLSSQS